MTNVLAVAEHRRGELRDVSYQLISAGRSLAATTGGNLHVAIPGGNMDVFTEALQREGVSVIHRLPVGEGFNHDVYTQGVVSLIEELEADFLVLPHSVNSLDYAPAVSTDTEMTLVPDVIDLAVDGGTLVATREMYGSKVETTIEIEEGPFAVTIREGEWPSAESLGEPEIRTVDFEPDESAVNSRVIGYEEIAAGDVDVADADFLIGVGRGIEEAETLDLLEELAEVTGGTLAASRPVVDNGWLPKNRQVGQSGKTVAPEVYLAIGISGAVQHVAGVRGAETIIAINTDPNAPIFDIADYGIVGDLFDVVPALIEAVR